MSKRRKAPSGKSEASRQPVSSASSRDRQWSEVIEQQSRLSWETARRLLLALFVTSLCLSILFAVRIPFDANPDESAHRDYVRLIIENRGFVQFIEREAAPGQPVYYETHQPPLYYVLLVPVYLLTGGSVFALRLPAALFQLATIYLVFRVCRDLFPGRPDLALGASAFAALLPIQAQLSGAINNDALTTLVCVALFWRMGLLVNTGQNRREAIVVGMLLGVGLLTKSSVLALLPTLLLAYVLAVRAGRLTGRDAALNAAFALGLAVLVASPWLIRNTRLYGDPLALSIYTATGPNFTPRQIMELSGWTFTDYLRNVGVRSFATFWYFLPPNLPFNRFAGNPGPLLLVVLVAVGGLLGTLRFLTQNSGEPGQRRATGLYLAGIFLLTPFFARFVLTVFQAQGRYFLPALLPIALVTCLGWAALAGRSRTIGTFTIPVLLFLMTLYALANRGWVV